MKKTIILDYSISNNDGRIQSLISEIESYDGEIDIFINSNGGDPFLGNIFTNVLNNFKDKVTLIATSTINSTAFKIFYDFKGNKKIMYGTMGMYHHITIGDISVHGAFKTPINDDVVTILDKCDSLAKQTNEVASKFCNKKELALIRKGQDVYFSFNRLREIFAQAEIMFC